LAHATYTRTWSGGIMHGGNDMAKTILVAGASRGIGLELVRQAAARGDRVTGTARGEEGAKRIREAGGEALILDVTEPEALAGAAGASDEPIDLLVCNAGINRGRGGIGADDLGPDAWADVMLTNVAGPFLTVRAFLPRVEAASGKVAIVSSVMGSSGRAYGGSYAYCASKAGATNLARNLAKELAGRVAVGAYHPGWVQTDMGGPNAAVTPKDSAAGLLARFDALSPQTTGVFEDYKGDAIPF
jgi:NAD(P)-dependent dehydrogenase (short-subunit alcohol dehydrogenase family)